MLSMIGRVVLAAGLLTGASGLRAAALGQTGGAFRSYLGVYVGDLTPEVARGVGYDGAGGVLVGSVEAGSPASKAGLAVNDCVVAINGDPIASRGDFFQVLMAIPPGTRVSLQVVRGGNRMVIEAELGRRRSMLADDRQQLYGEVEALLVSAEERRREAAELLARGDTAGAARLQAEERSFRELAQQRREFIETEPKNRQISSAQSGAGVGSDQGLSLRRYNLGLTLAALSPQLSAYFATGGGGLLVVDVRTGSAAERAGLRAGDCLLSLNGQPVSSASDIGRLADEALRAEKSGGRAVLSFSVVRDRARLPVAVEL